MFKHPFRLLGLVSVLVAVAFSQTTLDQQTANNTAACGNQGYCSASFTAMSDSNGVFNAAPGNVSLEDVHELLYSGNSTRVFAHFQPWFCMGSSSSTGTGSLCGSHIQVGYNSADSSTVHGQISDMAQRGFDGIVVDFYGTAGSASELTTTDMVNNDVANRCSGSQNCPFYFAVNYDQGAFMYKCPQNGGGTDQTQCILSHMETDFDYMNAHYFGALGYVRVDTSSMQISAAGSPVVYFFVCETCFTNPTPNWTSIWSGLQQYTASYGNNAPNLFMFRNSGGFTHAQSNGAFAWVNHENSSDTYGYVYLQKFYDAAVSALGSNPALVTNGAMWKGFDNSAAPWKPAASYTGPQCGQTWLQTFKQATHNSDFGSGKQLPFAEVTTWNDYEEGTEIETGIDNCLSLTAAMSNDGTTLTWTPTFSQSSGSEATVHHYLVFDSTDGSSLTQLAKVQSGSHSTDLTQFSLSSGAHTLYVQAVGQPSILNQMSNAVSFTPGTAAAVQSVSLNPTSVTGGNSSTGTVTLSQNAGANGTVVSLSSDNGAATVPAQVTIASGSSSGTFQVSTQSVTSNTTANISASITGGSSASAALTITPPAITVSKVSLNPASVTGGSGSTGTVTLSSAAGASGAVVTLSSNNGAANVPSQVTVPSGSLSATFSVTTSTVSSTTTASISASINGSNASANLTIQAPAAPTVASVVLNPVSVNGGSTSTGTVTLSQAAGTNGVTVSLSSNNSAASVPAQVTVSSGSSSASFTVTTTSVSSTNTATITASVGSSSASASLTISPTQTTGVRQLSFSSSSVGGSTQVTLTVKLSSAAPSGGASVKLTSTSSAVPVPSSITVSRGSTSASATITTRTVTSTTNATVTGSYAGTSQSATITVNVTPSSLTLSPTTVIGSATVTGTVTLTGAAPSGGESVQLKSSSSYASVPSSVTVPAGAKSVQFKLTTNKPSSTKNLTITATGLGVSKTASLTVKP